MRLVDHDSQGVDLWQTIWQCTQCARRLIHHGNHITVHVGGQRYKAHKMGHLTVGAQPDDWEQERAQQEEPSTVTPREGQQCLALPT